jgi:hypothetical protein
VSEPLRALKADADSTSAGVEVTLSTDDGDVTVTVPPVGRWYTEATEALEESKFNRWAELVLSDEDAEAWRSVRKRNDDVVAFFMSWQTAAGEAAGGSSASRGSSGSIARR